MERLTYISHGAMALAVGAIVLSSPAIAGAGLTMANALLGPTPAARAPYTHADPFLLTLFGTCMLAMGLFDALALVASSRELRVARCAVGLAFNGGNALLAALFFATQETCPGYVVAIIPSDGLFGLLYGLTLLSLLRRQEKTKKVH